MIATIKFEAPDAITAKHLVSRFESVLSRFGLRLGSVELEEPEPSDEELGPAVSEISRGK